MSLVNEALRKARAEATRQEARRADFQLPLLERGSRRQHQQSLTPAVRTLVSLAATLAVAVLLVVWLVRTVTPNERGVPQARAVNAEALATNSASALPDPGPGTTAADESGGVEMAEAPPEAPPEAATPSPADADVAGGAARTSSREESAGLTSREPSPQRPNFDSGSSRSATRESAARRSPSEVPDAPSLSAESDSPVAQQSASVRQIPGSISTQRQGASTVATPATGAADAAAEGEPVRVDSDSTAAGDVYMREAEIPGVGVFRLDGIAWSTDQPFALLNGEVVGRGGFVDGFAVADITPDRVVLAGEDRRFVIRLR